MNVEILYEDKYLIACAKPQGMPVQDDKSRDLDLVNYLKNYLNEKDKTQPPEVFLLHRLDRPVGGVTLFAKTKEAAAKLSSDIANRRVVKYYEAVLTGTLSKDEGTLTDYLLKDSKTNMSKVVDKDVSGAKEAVLNYEVLDVIETDQGVFSYVLIELITGRHHQIRVQMANAKAGIWGDTKYNSLFSKVKRVYKQIGLYCTRMEIEHPITGEKLVFKAFPEGEAFDLIDAQEI